jgi:glycosyltransferase involved in cell wall biosynthesis
MKILFIAHYFQPEPNFFVGLPFAKALQSMGHEVQVLTGLPNYPGGKIYDGYKVRLIQKEVMDGIPIIRVPIYPSHNRSSAKRILSYLSLSMSQAAVGPFAVNKADVAFVSQGPATIGLPAIIHKLFRKIPFVYNIQDLWPDTLFSTGMFESKMGLRMVDWWCKRVYKKAARIAVIAPGMKRKLIERGVPQEKIEVIYNWCDGKLICRDQRDEQLADSLNMAGKFNIVFAGNMGKAQALDALIDAARLLASDCPDVQFVLVGPGVEVEALKQKAAEMNLSNVLFVPPKPSNEIGPILRLADVLLVHLKEDPLFEITIPSKTQAYMATGRPILIGVKGDAADLVGRAGAGLACEPENPESIAEKVKQFYNMSKSEIDLMGNNAIDFYDRELSFERAVKSYDQLLQAAASG